MLSNKKVVTWVFVADGKEAHAYLWHADALTPIPDLKLKAESIDDYDISRRNLGTVFESSSTVRHNVQPRLDIHDEIRSHFAKAILDCLNEASEKEAFDKFILVAPDKLLGLIRKGLSKKTHERLLADVPKNWTHYDSAELIQHVKDILWK
jgi:protein required for attachment to host cells